MLITRDLFHKFIKYCFVGFICTFIYFLAVFVLVEILDRDPLLGSSLSFVIMTCFSFLLNIKYTFGSDFSASKLLRFFIVAAVGFFLNYVIIFSIVNVLSLHYFIGELVTILVIPLINFILNNYWTFKQKQPGATV